MAACIWTPFQVVQGKTAGRYRVTEIGAWFKNLFDDILMIKGMGKK
jgi:hypothetical protein